MRGTLWIAIALLACAACTSSSGTSTGNPAPREPDGGDAPPDIDTGGGLATNGYCKPGAMTPLELDQDSPLGFSAADVLAFSAGTHEEAIRWNEQAGLTLSPENGEHTITITVTPSGEPRFVEPAPEGAGGGPGGLLIETHCVSWVEIDVDVTVKTSGGALDETFQAALRAHHPLTSSLFYAPDPDMLGGDFAVSVSGELEGSTLVQLGLNIRFSPYGTGGTFAGLLERSSDDDSDGTSSGRGAPFATFGANTCGDNADGFTVGLTDAVEGVTLQDALDLFGADEEVDITWETGATTTSSFAFAPATAGGCVQLDNQTIGDLTLLTEGTLAMASADERLDGSWPGRIEAHVDDDGSISRIEFKIAAKLPSHTMPGANVLYGFPNDAIDAFDAADVSADITVTSAGVEGTVALTGYVFADCEQAAPDQPSDADPSDPGAAGSSSPGCRAAEPVTIANGVVR